MIDISIVDYLDKRNDGVPILMSWIMDDVFYEFIFWFNSKHDYIIYSGDKLNKRLNVDDIHNWDFIDHLVIYLNTIIPPKMEIFDKYNIKY